MPEREFILLVAGDGQVYGRACLPRCNRGFRFCFAVYEFSLTVWKQETKLQSIPVFLKKGITRVRGSV